MRFSSLFIFTVLFPVVTLAYGPCRTHLVEEVICNVSGSADPDAQLVVSRFAFFQNPASALVCEKIDQGDSNFEFILNRPHYLSFGGAASTGEIERDAKGEVFRILRLDESGEALQKSLEIPFHRDSEFDRVLSIEGKDFGLHFSCSVVPNPA